MQYHARSLSAHLLTLPLFTLGLASVSLATSTLSLAAQDAVAPDVQAELDALQRDIDQLRTQGIGSAGWLSQQRAADIRAVVTDMVSDAATRTSLQDAPATAGYKDGFFISSADGAYTLKLSGFMQQRFSYDYRPSVNGVTGGAQQDTWGFETTRLKFFADGSFIDPSWKYRVEVATSAGTFSVQDAWLDKTLAEGLTLRMGQFKNPFLREFLLPDVVTMMVDRSNVEGFFTPGRTLGVQLNWLSGDVQLTGAFTNGFAVKSNYFTSGDMRNQEFPSTKDAEYAFAARGEWKAAGEWAQFKDPAGWKSDGFGMLVGIGGEVEQKNNNQGVPAAYGDLEPFVMAASVDLSVEWSGASILTYGVWRQVDPGDSAYAAANQYGFMLQGGVFVSDNVQLVARYEYGDADTRPNGEPPVLNAINNNGYSTLSTAGVGFDWYINKQRLKISGDLCYAFDGIGAFANSVTGFLPDGTSSSGEFNQGGQTLARLQLQVMW